MGPLIYLVGRSLVPKRRPPAGFARWQLKVNRPRRDIKGFKSRNLESWSAMKGVIATLFNSETTMTFVDGGSELANELAVPL